MTPHATLSDRDATAVWVAGGFRTRRRVAYWRAVWAVLRHARMFFTAALVSQDDELEGADAHRLEGRAWRWTGRGRGG